MSFTNAAISVIKSNTKLKDRTRRKYFKMANRPVKLSPFVLPKEKDYSHIIAKKRKKLLINWSIILMISVVLGYIGYLGIEASVDFYKKNREKVIANIEAQKIMDEAQDAIDYYY